MQTGILERTTTVTEKRNEMLDLDLGVRCKEVATAANQVGMALWLIRKCGSIEAAKAAVNNAADAVTQMQSVQTNRSSLNW